LVQTNLGATRPGQGGLPQVRQRAGTPSGSEQLSKLGVVLVHRRLVSVGNEDREKAALRACVSEQITPRQQVRVRVVRGGLSRSQPFDRVNELLAVQPKVASRSDIAADEGEYDRRERLCRAERVHAAN